MRFGVSAVFVLAAGCLAVAVPAHSQGAPSAFQGGPPLVVGAGFSNYNVDFGMGRRESGGTFWANWNFRRIPAPLQGLGVDIEARALSIGAPASLPNMRYDTVAGGAIYHIPHFRTRTIRPYAKFLVGYGSIDFPPYPNGYSHDTRTFFAMGGGGDFHAWKHLWVRADYEYQMWYGLFGRGHALTPNGVTVGPEFDFGRASPR
jgi:hypothetical protein